MVVLHNGSLAEARRRYPLGCVKFLEVPYERVVGFFNSYRDLYPVSKAVLRDIATQYGHWVTAHAKPWGAPILEGPAGERRDKFVDPYFRRAEPDHIVVILKAREPARILVAIGKDDHWHLEYKRRWPDQYSFYVFDREWGRMFVRVCPYFPFSARVCLNQHHWLANRMRAEDMTFRQQGNVLFLKLFERVYAPLTAGLLHPVPADTSLTEQKRHRLDRLYQRIATDFDVLLREVGLRHAA